MEEGRKARDRDICAKTMGSEVVEEGATGTMAGRRKPEEGSVRQDAGKNKGGTCIRFPTGDKRRAKGGFA